MLTVTEIVMGILDISTILVVAEAAGLLPGKLSKWINRNRPAQTLEVLKEMGIDIDKHKRANISTATPVFFSQGDLTQSLICELNKATIRGEIEVGQTRIGPGKSFIDLMGVSVNSQKAVLFARYLSTYWSEILRDPGRVQYPKVDFIVAPKSGSPFIAYELAKIWDKPLVLHEEHEKFKADIVSLRKKFDYCDELPLPGSVALLVDDSATGGRKVRDALNDLRQAGYHVGDCLLVFEPTVKGVSNVLKSEGINVHSIVKLDPLGELS